MSTSAMRDISGPDQRVETSSVSISHTLLLAAVMSLLAFVILSRRSWCSSSSALKASNMGINGDFFSPKASSADLFMLW